MIKVITYGTYDLLHEGHINLLKRAKELGDYLIVGVTADNFDKERGKLNVRNNVLERVESIRKLGYADEIIIEEYVGQKIDDIEKFNVDIFAIGSDWIGKFDYLKEICDVVYLPRTEGISSTSIRSEKQETLIGIIGTGRIATRFIPETEFVNGVKVISVLNPDYDEARSFATLHNISNIHTCFDTFIEDVDAVYIATPHITHYKYIEKSLLANKHVLCEIPMVLCKDEASYLYKLAERQKVVLLEANKTAHCPAFNRMIALVKGGAIGSVIEIRASLSKLLVGNIREFDKKQAGGCMTELSSLPLLPIIKILGINYTDLLFFSKMRNGVDVFTKGIINYNNAIATITLGLEVKTEGNLVISGTDGYIYVPAPWWKTEYFELRFEDINKNKKYFYSYDGDGLRYELQEFISMIVNNRHNSHRLKHTESIVIAEIIEKYRSGKYSKEIK